MPLGTIADIDGYTMNESKEIVTALMQKREYDVKDHGVVSEGRKLRDSIFRVEEKKEWKLRHKISAILNIPLFLALWPIDYPMKNRSCFSEPIVVYRLKMKSGVLNFRHHLAGDVGELTNFIRALRGRSFSRIKTLKVATTMMECYLAVNTRDPWPGDLDAAIWDQEKKVITAIIEFKTHNHPRYSIRRQYFGQWPGDERRYKALDIMQKHLEVKSAKPKFIYAIWGTDRTHTEVKLQSIDNLKAHNSRLVKRPFFTAATTEDFTKDLLAYIKT